MRPQSRAVLGAAVVFAIAMDALESGGWWWAWLTGITVMVLGRGVRLPLLGVKLNPTNAYIMRENRKTRRHTRHLARQRRRRIRDQRRAQRARQRQTR